jgi:NAD dependent epimerase/dehydratase family enzyme
MILKQELQKQFLARKLFEAAQEWDSINQTTIDKSVDPMLRRLGAVLAANGGLSKRAP